MIETVRSRRTKKQSRFSIFKVFRGERRASKTIVTAEQSMA